MASIETLTRADGSPSYKVRWYVKGERGVRTFSEPEDHDKAKSDAIAYKALLERNELDQERTERLIREAKHEGPTVGDVFNLHIRQLTNVGAGQLARYEKSVPMHFGALNNLRIANLTQADIRAWVKAMEASGYKPKTISNHKGFLAAALNTAVSEQLIPHNPSKGVKVSKGLDYEDKIHYITEEQWVGIMAHMPAHYAPFFIFLLASGCRFGEATALKAKDFDLDGETSLVRVHKAWKEDGAGGHVLGAPKTAKGRRTVSVPPETIEAIKGQIMAAGDGLVFTNTKGDRLLSSLAHQKWGAACGKAGISIEDRPRIHDIRHTHASIMLQRGFDMFQLSRRLGHSNIQMTVDTYSDLMPDAHFEGAKVASAALEGYRTRPALEVLGDIA